MKYDLEQFDAFMSNAMQQLEDLIASLKLERAKLEQKQQPSAPTTIEQVYYDVESRCRTLARSVPSLCNVNQVDAFAQLLTLVDCLDSHFGEGWGKEYVYVIDREYDVYHRDANECNKPLITFKTKDAADHALEHFLPLFKRYYGVSE